MKLGDLDLKTPEGRAEFPLWAGKFTTEKLEEYAADFADLAALFTEAVSNRHSAEIIPLHQPTPKPIQQEN